jgi:2,3,4,5-tetrahydropyridine-2,6-dicarboxylate N-succinyltransferase
MKSLQAIIETAWEARTEISTTTNGDVRDAVNAALAQLDAGTLRVAEKTSGAWVVNTWVKQAILLSFRLNGNVMMQGGAYDKVPLKTEGWSEAQFADAGFRMVPGAVVRRGSFIDKNVVLMPSFINIGAHVGEGTMVDTWATIGSCAQIGKHCHISGGTGIGGVLEPLQANPVIIEDNCFIGARSEVAEGVIVEEGSVISMGVFLGASTKIINRATGEISYGRIPAYSVVVPGTLPASSPMLAASASSPMLAGASSSSPLLAGGTKGGNHPSLACAVIVKQVDAKTRSKTGINELLRD